MCPLGLEMILNQVKEGWTEKDLEKTAALPGNVMAKILDQE